MTLELEKSAQLFAEAQEYIPGGVNSPVRAFKAVGFTPVFIQKAKGSRIYDEDGNSYIDYVGSWGPMILGHAHPNVIQAIQEAAARGTSYGAPTAVETKLAKMIRQALPVMEMVRLVNSGTEATMSAIRVARGYTGRDKIIKFEGCYHGHADSLLVSAGSGATTLGVPNSPGVPAGAVQDTILVRYNDLEAVEKAFASYPDQIAAVIVEPVAGNMGLVPPKEGFLQGLRDITRRYGTVLIFDEVMTGFRVAYGGAQILYGIEPDMTCLGKIIGGGMPLAAYGGKKEIMSKVAPAGPVYQAGTLSGNPLAVAAGVATLELLTNGKTYDDLTAKTHYLAESIKRMGDEAGVPVQANVVGAMFTIFFTGQPVVDYDTAKTCNTEAFGGYFRLMLAQGVYLPPSQFEACFLSTAHSNADLEVTIGAARLAMQRVAKGEYV